MWSRLFTGPADWHLLLAALVPTFLVAWLAGRYARRGVAQAMRALLADTLNTSSRFVRAPLRVVGLATFLIVFLALIFPAFEIAGPRFDVDTLEDLRRAVERLLQPGEVLGGAMAEVAAGDDVAERDGLRNRPGGLRSGQRGSCERERRGSSGEKFPSRMSSCHAALRCCARPR